MGKVKVFVNAYRKASEDRNKFSGKWERSFQHWHKYVEILVNFYASLKTISYNNLTSFARKQHVNCP